MSQQTSHPVAQTASSNSQPRGTAAAKMPGLGANTAGLTCKGAQLNAEQIKVCNIALAVGAQLSAPTEALVALIYAGMGESSLGGDPSTFSTGGVWQTTGVPSAYGGGSDIAGQAHGFLTGGTSFNGSAISLARGGAPAWQIANQVENNAVWLSSHGDSYAHQFPGGQAQGIGEARKIVQAGGGGSLAGASGTTVGSSGVAQPYYFTVGAKESYWDAMNRMAEEVGWELLTDGDRMYYDSDLALIKQKPAAVIARDDAAVVDWSGDWDARHIATQMSLTLICDDFAFRPGEVFELQKFGPYSSGSTADLPGRWLISDFTRTKGDVSTVFTLVQPTRPKLEPAPQIAAAPAGAGSTVSIGTAGAGGPGFVNASSTIAGHPEVKAGVAKVFNMIKSQFPAITITATTNGTHVSGSYHYQGRAIDFVAANMDQIGTWIAQNLTAQLTEGIHNPTLAVKDGKSVNGPSFYAAVWAGHTNHIHIAV